MNRASLAAASGQGLNRKGYQPARRAASGPGYSFPSASGQEVWKHHITPTAGPQKLTDARIARLLKVPEGMSVSTRRFSGRK